ncbi:MAG: branched-chain amino acid ABC transporter permease [Firmicutes bacterium]|nr:branched-chain amino acid ABC transporter permease [Bacillota bacterium]
MTEKLKYATRDRLVTYSVVVIAFLISQILVVTGVASHKFTGLLIPISVNILLAVSLNLVVGISGELSLGHAGFMCIGAYAGSLFSVLTQGIITSSYIRFPLAILLGGIVAAILGFLIGIPVLRLRGDYLAIVTLAFGEIIKNIFNNMYLAADKNGVFFSMTAEKYTKHVFDAATKVDYIKGAQGITGTPQDSNFVICFIVIMIALFVLLNLIDSKTGRNIMAARDNRIAAEAMGINVTKAKMTAFVVSSFFAGVAGVLYSHNLKTLVATKFDYNLSILVLVFVVLGGMNKMRNVIISATILYALPEALRFLSDYRMLLYAIVLIVMMILNNNKGFIAAKKRLSPRNLFKKSVKEVTK